MRYVFLPLGGLCNPVRTEQELTLAFDPKQVVASFSYSNREINLADRYHDRGRPLGRGTPTTVPVPVIYNGSQVAETR